MFKDVLNHMNVTALAEIGLIIFFAVFVLTSIWTLTRPRDEVRQWSRLPLDSDLDRFSSKKERQ